MSEMTERQKAAWPEAVAEAQKYVDTSTIPTDSDHYEWVMMWASESRPGRGHALSALWLDGAYVVTIRMDVYGYPSVAVADTNWVHNSSDDECNCEPCVTEREGGSE